MSQSGPSENARCLLLGIYRPDQPDDEIYLSDGLTIGRSGANDIQLEANSPEIASRHAHVVADDRGGYLLICDYPGSTVTPLGPRGEELDPVTQLRLRDSTQFRIGQTTLHCFLGQEAAPTRPPQPDAACPLCDAELPAPALGQHLCVACSSVLFSYMPDKSAPSIRTIGADYDEYRVDTFVASGALGPVFHAVRRDRPGSSPAKSGPPEAAIKIFGRGHDPSNGSRLDGSIRTMERLMSLGCPYIVRLIDSGIAPNGRFLILEWIDGLALEEYLRIARRRQERIQLVLVLRWLEELARALSAVHQAGHTHGSLTPSKIMLDKSRRLRISDFGATRLGSRSTATDGSLSVAGEDAEYCAPEQLRGSPQVDAQADQYALGKIAHELVTGSKPPAPGKIDEPGLRRRKLTDSMTLRIRNVFLTLLADNPSDRFPSCEEVASAFHELSETRAKQRPAGSRRPVPVQPSVSSFAPQARAARPSPQPRVESTAVQFGVLGSTLSSFKTRDEPVDFEPVVPELDDGPAVAPKQQQRPLNIPLILSASLAVVFFGLAAWHWIGRRSDDIGFGRERETSQQKLDEAQAELRKAQSHLEELDSKAKGAPDLQKTIKSLGERLESERAKTRLLQEAIERLEKQLKSGPPVGPDHTSLPRNGAGGMVARARRGTQVRQCRDANGVAGTRVYAAIYLIPDVAEPQRTWGIRRLQLGRFEGSEEVGGPPPIVLVWSMFDGLGLGSQTSATLSNKPKPHRVAG
jgi:serine/threonine protein kinase